MNIIVTKGLINAENEYVETQDRKFKLVFVYVRNNNFYTIQYFVISKSWILGRSFYLFTTLSWTMI